MKRINQYTSSSSLVGLLLFLLIWLQPLLADVNVQLSHRTTSLEEPVRLVLQIEGENSASPDLSVLQQDFEILGRSSQQNISIVNGRMSKTQGLTLTLLPRHTGHLTIPAIPVGEENSAPLSLEVVGAIDDSEGSSKDSAFIQLTLNKSQAYLQEEIILTVRLYQADSVRGESLSKPQATLQNTLVRLIHEEQYPEEHAGLPYRVTEQRYAIFAHQTGRLQLGKVRFRGRSGPGGQSPFSLTGDPVNNSFPQTRIIRTTSDQIGLDILPVPAEFTGKHWLPARNLQLIERDSQRHGSVLAGNPATRHIKIFADGLTSAQLPVIELEAVPGIKTYAARPQIRDMHSREGISGSRQNGVTFIATEPGSYTLPAVEIPWWNVTTDRMETARLPAITLDILPSLGRPLTVGQQLLRQPVEESPVTDALLKGQTIMLSDDNETTFPTWLVWTLGIGWLATLTGWWLSRRRKKPRTATEQQGMVEEPPKDELPAILDALELAYQDIDQEAARTAWLNWGRYSWPANPPSNLNRLAKRCGHNIALAVSALDRAFYSPENSNDWREFNPRELLAPANPIYARQIHKDMLLPIKPAQNAKGMQAFVCRPFAEDRAPLILPPIHHNQR